MEQDGDLVEKILSAHPEKFGHLLQNASQYRFQVLLSQVKRLPSGERKLLRHGYRVDAEYFYPASAIKLAAVVAAVEKLERFHTPEGLGREETKDHEEILREKPAQQVQQIEFIRRLFPAEVFGLATPICFCPLFEDGEEQKCDPTNLNDHKITLAHEIRKLFLVSDNEAFNRLYGVVGHRSLNEIMWENGFKSARFHHRLSVYLSPSLNQCCGPVKVDVDCAPYVLAPKRSQLVVPDNRSIPGVLVGEAHITESGELIGEPMDFSLKNYVSLMDLQDLLVRLVRPDIELLKPGTRALQIGGGVRMMLLEAMSQYPASSFNPHYDRAEYPDDYGKFFLPGVARVRSKGAIRMYNKVGRAYGFTIDNAYVMDIETGQSFFLSAVIYTNKNEIVNDNVYEYEEIADKAMADLGEVIADSFWKVPDKATNISSPLDQTPSSLWSVVNRRIGPDSPPDSLLDPRVQEKLSISIGGQNALVVEEVPIKVKTVSTVESTVKCPTKSEGNIKSCYQYFVDE